MLDQGTAAADSGENPLPTSPEALFSVLSGLGIPYTLHRHPAVFTVAESAGIERAIPGAHCRNLFLRDKKENMLLVVAQNETLLDLKKLAALLGAGRLSFGSPERLWKVLGIRPGSVCPFCLINDKERAVRVVLDAAMMRHDIVNYHPLDNRMTVGLSPADLLRFIGHTGHAPEIVDLTPAAPDEKEQG